MASGDDDIDDDVGTPRCNPRPSSRDRRFALRQSKCPCSPFDASKSAAPKARGAALSPFSPLTKLYCFNQRKTQCRAGVQRGRSLNIAYPAGLPRGTGGAG
jgi:hypothetical protein